METLDAEAVRVLSRAVRRELDARWLNADEHRRWAVYKECVELGDEQLLAVLAPIVAREQDGALKNSVTVSALDLSASHATSRQRVDDWWQEWSDVLYTDEFVRRRVAEWLLIKEAEMGELRDLDAALSASNWCQLQLIARASGGELLTALADGGRTKRIRRVASERLARNSR